MKKMKKALAVILSLAMVLGMSLTSFAAPEAPETMPNTKVTVNGVETGCTVTAYQIIRYEQKGKFVNVENGSISNMEEPTAEEILAISKKITSGGTTFGSGTPLTEVGTSYEANLDAGMWIVLVKGSGATIYNPMIVSVNVDETGAVGGSVDANGNFQEGEVEVYAKSSTTDITKTVKDPAYEINDSVNFKVETTIPAYSESYQSVIFKIYDELIGGLEYVEDSVKVTIDDKEHEVVPTFDTSESGNPQMTIDISNVALANAGKEVVVTYSAKLTDEQKEWLKENGGNINPTTNKATIEYTHNPYDENDTTKDDDETHHYTFGIDASVTGSTGSIHQNFIKTAEGKTEIIDGEEVRTPGEPLAGAEFEIVKKDADGNYVKIDNIPNVVSNEQGLTKFVGLDANVTYYLHEVKAPQGYTVVDKYVPVYIDAKFDDHGKLLNGWTVKIGEGQEETLTGSYTWDVNTGETTLIPVDPSKEEPENPYFFENTKLANLPSTGGIGTTIFTIGGCAIMIIAAALFFASRRKAVK